MSEKMTSNSPEAAVEGYREFVEKSHETEERKDLANRALDTYVELAGKADIQPDELQPLVEASMHPHKFVWDIGTVFLVKLAVAHEVARIAVTELARHKKADVRDSIVWALNDSSPRDFVLQVLRGALSDRSKQVRQQAIKVADMLRIEELVPDLNELLQSEKNEDVRKILQFHIPMMTDGYRLAYNERNEPQLIVRTNNGWGSPRVTQQDIDEGRLPDIIQEMLSKPYL